MEPQACPFCGSNKTSLDFTGQAWREWRIRCTQCQAQGPGHRDSDVAVFLWNSRSGEAEAEATGAMVSAVRHVAEESLQKYRTQPTARWPGVQDV